MTNLIGVSGRSFEILRETIADSTRPMAYWGACTDQGWLLASFHELEDAGLMTLWCELHDADEIQVICSPTTLARALFA